MKKSLIPRWFAVMVALSALVVALGSLRAERRAESRASDLTDYLWLDRYPEMTHDNFQIYFFSADNVGAHADFASSYKVLLEVFEFKADGQRVQFHFPHDGKRPSSAYRIEKLKKPTRHFDTQLTVQEDPKNGGRTKVYYTGPGFRAGHLPAELRRRLGPLGRDLR